MSYIELENIYILLFIPFFILCELKCKRKTDTIYFSNIKQILKSTSKFNLKIFLKYFAIIMLIFAISSPIISKKYQLSNVKALPFILCIDASESMEYDFDDEITENSKFKISKDIATEFINKRHDDKIALLFFGDYPYVASPLTFDKEYLKKVLQLTRVNIAGFNSSTIFDTLFLASLELKKTNSPSKIIILISDGTDKDSTTKYKSLKNIISKNNITLYSIILTKQTINSHLEELSKSSGGEFFIAKSKEDIREIFQNIDDLKKQKYTSKSYNVIKRFYQIPLFLSFLAFLIFLYLYNKRSVI